MVPISFAPFDPRAARADFDCGNHEINEWFRTQAGQQHRRDVARTTVGWDVAGSRIASFYTLVAHQVEPGPELRELIRARHRHPLPAILIAQLGVDTRYQGQGAGGLTLGHALRRILSLSESLGFQVVVVDAIDENAREFYLRNGFHGGGQSADRLVMTTSQLRARIVRM